MLETVHTIFLKGGVEMLIVLVSPTPHFIHRKLVERDRTATVRPLYTVIVENGTHVQQNLKRLQEALGEGAMAWVQLGPPALEQLEVYRQLKREGIVTLYGVEDFTISQVEMAHQAFGVATVQQVTTYFSYLSAIARPSHLDSPPTHTCRRLTLLLTCRH